MKQIIIIKRGELTAKDKGRLTKSGIIYIEAEYPSDVRVESLTTVAMDDSSLIQILTDEENQPSQYGTVPLSWYENVENKIERMRFNISEIIDSLDGTYEKHAIRKKLQDAIEYLKD